ncbi:MAG: phosphate signaling complex protein PhoU [Kofleriaceae bacterium]|nr:MAG: phosphate signaling complex protein PhoU [Kofleriaceae bacterium]MBZ0230777.1 phosphate signaling complex protein PhoU [Kofleriaceae bacterium]
MGVPRTHTDREYEAELRELKDKLLKMAGLVEDMITSATQALVRGDTDLARRTIQADAQVNALEVETDELCLLVLARRQPVASDLRMITLAMKMVTDLERIGDLAVNIGERVLALGAAPSPSVAERITRMSEVGQRMIRDAIDAFVASDVSKARTVFSRDQYVDDAYRELASEMQQEMMRDRDFVNRGIHLQACSKFLERIADHGTNLAEMVIFQVEGKDVRHKPGR